MCLLNVSLVTLYNVICTEGSIVSLNTWCQCVGLVYVVLRHNKYMYIHQAIIVPLIGKIERMRERKGDEKEERGDEGKGGVIIIV